VAASALSNIQNTLALPAPALYLLAVWEVDILGVNGLQSQLTGTLEVSRKSFENWMTRRTEGR
jgi:hypothetical protein